MDERPNERARGMRFQRIPAVKTSVQKITHDARLVLRSEQSAQLDALRERAWMQVGMMAGGRCPT